MLKLCWIDFIMHEDAPVVNGHKSREMILKDAENYNSTDVERLFEAIKRINPVVESAYRINPVKEAAEEYKNTIAALNTDNVESALTVDRRFRSYVLEFDMFLDYWEAYIAHHKRINGADDDNLVRKYKELFKRLTNAAYDNHVEYQLLDMIRNQTAHVQSPVNRIHVGIDGNEAYSDRDILLDKCRSGEKKKELLKKQPKELALSPIVDATAKYLSDIHDGLMDFLIDDYVMQEFEPIAAFMRYIASKGDLLYQPWVLLNDTKIPLEVIHIRDLKAYAYILGRVERRKNAG